MGKVAVGYHSLWSLQVGSTQREGEITADERRDLAAVYEALMTAGEVLLGRGRSPTTTAMWTSYLSCKPTYARGWSRRVSVRA